MAYPSQFFDLIYPKRRSYIHYWWENYESNGNNYDDLLDILTQSKQMILSNGAARLAANIQKQYRAAGVALGNDELAAIDIWFDAENNKIVDMGAEGVLKNEAALQSSGSANDEMGDILSAALILRDSAEDAVKFQQNLTRLVGLISSYEPLYQELYDFVLLNFQQAKKYGGQCASINNIVSDVLKASKGTIRKLSSGGAILSGMKPAVRRWLAQLYLLTDSSLTVSNRADIERAIREKTGNLWNDIQGALAEVARRQGKAEAQELGLGALVKLNEKLETIVTGTEGATVEEKKDPRILQMYQQIQQKSANARSSISFKGDDVVVYSKVQQKSDNEIRTTTGVTIGGITSKSTISTLSPRKADGHIIAEMKFQDGTSLFTALERELSLSAKVIEEIIQLATASSNSLSGGSELAYMWESLKEYVTYSMFMTALTGKDNETTPTLIQINNTLLPMTYFINSVLAGGMGGLNRGDIANLNIKGFPNRKVFYEPASTSWVEPEKTAKQSAGYTRSENVYATALAKLYSTKVTIRFTSIDLTLLAGNYNLAF